LPFYFQSTGYGAILSAGGQSVKHNDNIFSSPHHTFIACLMAILGEPNECEIETASWVLARIRFVADTRAAHDGWHR
jgi:hypothetical protein